MFYALSEAVKYTSNNPVDTMAKLVLGTGDYY